MRSGQRIGKYVLGERIARGGMAEVWAARVEGPGGFVKSLALKFILESFTGDPDLERLFLNEARVAAKLQHANLVGVFDFDKLVDAEAGGPGRFYIAMERVDGHDLRRVVQVARHNGRRLPPALALYVAGEVLKGLRYVHERTDESGRKPLGLVHRDVSPHNVLVGMGGEVKLSDFGIAKAMTQSLGTQTGTIRGKLAYASPEQLRGEPADHRTDQFGLGVTLWEMLADRRLFNGADEVEIVGKVLRCEIPPLPTDAGIDAAVESVVRRMLAGQPGDRFSSTADALSAVLSAPGYVAEGAGVAALMHDLFRPRLVALPPTVPLNLAAAPAVGGLAETSPLEQSPSPIQLMDSPGAPGGRVVESMTGSGHDSAGSSALPGWIVETDHLPRPKRFVWIGAAIAVAALGGIAHFARRADKQTAPAAATIVPQVLPAAISNPVARTASAPVPSSDQASATPVAPAEPAVGKPPVAPVGQALGGASPPASMVQARGNEEPVVPAVPSLDLGSKTVPSIAPPENRKVPAAFQEDLRRPSISTKPAVKDTDEGSPANASPVLE